MITLIKMGHYQIEETFGHTKMLVLDDKTKFAWINAGKIGEVLVASKKKFTPSEIVAIGNYRLYKVQDETDLTDLEHLELFVGEGKWQGYLLPNGLPNGIKRRKIIPTSETITRTTH